MKSKKTALSNFRIIALLEGFSYLALLIIAMPLKYWFQIPAPVKYMGWLHGVLFILYIILLIQVFIKLRWTFQKTVIAFIVSFVPFGTFWLDVKLKEEIKNIAK